MATTVKPEESKDYGRFIFDERTNGKDQNVIFNCSLEVLHFSESPEQDMIMRLSSGYMGGFCISNMVNCGVYLFTVSEMYKEPVF